MTCISEFDSHFQEIDLCICLKSDFSLIEPPMTIKVEERPWGRFELFTLNEQSTVKLVYVHGDKRLSLQYHNNRSELWKVIKGPARVQIGNDTKTLETGESITIPKKAIHRLIGAGTDAVILEISLGEFDESDIVRLEDDYKRQ